MDTKRLKLWESSDLHPSPYRAAFSKWHNGPGAAAAWAAGGRGSPQSRGALSAQRSPRSAFPSERPASWAPPLHPAWRLPLHHPPQPWPFLVLGSCRELSCPRGMSPFPGSGQGCWHTSLSSLLLCVLLKERVLSTRATAAPREGVTLSSPHFVSVHNCHLTGPHGDVCFL